MVATSSTSIAPTGSAEELLAAAAAVGDRPTRADLTALGTRLQVLAQVTGAADVAATMSDDEPRRVLATDADNRVVVLRRYAPGESSTLHAHGWAVLLQLAGDGAFERWLSGPDGGPARLVEVERMGPGSVVVLTDGEVHRQPPTGSGHAELVVYRGEAPTAPPRVDHTPDPLDLAAAVLVHAYVDAYRRADADAVVALLDPDVRVDVNIPKARFSLDVGGTRAVLAADEFVDGYHLAAWRARPMAAGAVVELTARFGDQGAREMHLLTFGGGKLTGLTIFCTGIWNIP